MKCVICGAEINEGEQYCPVCGSQQPVQKKKIDRRILMYGIGAAALAVLLLCVHSILPVSVNVTKGVTPVYYGAEGYGYVYFDQEVPSWENKNYVKMMTPENDEDVGVLFKMLRGPGYESKDVKVQRLRNSLLCDWSDSQGNMIEQGTLHNGDKVVYACTYDTEAGKDAGYKFTGLKTTYTVSGLPEAKEIDVFEGVEVYWTYDLYDGFRPAIDDTNASAKNLGASYYVMDYDADGTVFVSAEDSQFYLLSQAYVCPEGYVKAFNIGRTPTLITDSSDKEAGKVAQAATDPLFIADMNSCSNELNLDGKPQKIKSYNLRSIDTTYSESLQVVYNVVLSEKTFQRYYYVYVFKTEDGKYHAEINEDYSSYEGCEVSEYWSTWD